MLQCVAGCCSDNSLPQVSLPHNFLSLSLPSTLSPVLPPVLSGSFSYSRSPFQTTLDPTVLYLFIDLIHRSTSECAACVYSCVCRHIDSDETNTQRTNTHILSYTLADPHTRILATSHVTGALRFHLHLLDTFTFWDTPSCMNQSLDSIPTPLPLLQSAFWQELGVSS